MTYLYAIPADRDGVHGTIAQRLAFGNAMSTGDSCVHWLQRGINPESVAELAREAAHYAFEALPDLRLS